MKCAICGQPTVKELIPFCSKTCQQQDLLHWLQGYYRVPSNEPVVNSCAADEEECDD